MSLQKGMNARRFAAAVLDWGIEFTGGVMGSYMGAMIAALVTAMKDAPAEQMQSSIWSGLGFGFVFWTLSISFLNRVLIQGVSRSSLGKKVFKLELISTQGELTWNVVMTRWVASFISLGFHDLIAHTDVVPVYEGKTISVEQRTEAPMTMAQIHQLLILSNSQAERPTATVIQLPVRERTLATGTAGLSVMVNEAVALAPVIQINPSKDHVSEEEAVEDEKKVA